MTVLLYDIRPSQIGNLTEKSCQSVQPHFDSFGEKKSASFGRSFLLQSVSTTLSAHFEFVAEISAIGHTLCGYNPA